MRPECMMAPSVDNERVRARRHFDTGVVSSRMAGRACLFYSPIALRARFNLDSLREATAFRLYPAQRRAFAERLLPPGGAAAVCRESMTRFRPARFLA